MVIFSGQAICPMPSAHCEGTVSSSWRDGSNENNIMAIPKLGWMDLPGAVWGGLQNWGSWIAMETGYWMSAARMAWWKYGGLRERERTPRRSSAEVSCWSQRASVFVMPVMLVGRVFFLLWKVRWTSRCAVVVMFRESSGLFGYFSAKGTSLKAAFLKVTSVAVHLSKGQRLRLKGDSRSHPLVRNVNRVVTSTNKKTRATFVKPSFLKLG